MSQHLYRFYGHDSALLYIGITFNPSTRFRAHSSHQAWWDEVDRITLESYPDRPSVVHAEQEAIKRETPRYNVAHNTARRSPPASVGEHLVTFRSSGEAQWCNLTLYPELECSACVESIEDATVDPFEYYVQYLRRHHPAWLEDDAVPILWSVEDASRGIAETAPFQGYWKRKYPNLEDFLTFCEWPTTRNGALIDWLTLPVANSRFPAFARALNWTPAAMQQTASLASIRTARQGRSQQ